MTIRIRKKKNKKNGVSLLILVGIIILFFFFSGLIKYTSCFNYRNDGIKNVLSQLKNHYEVKQKNNEIVLIANGFKQIKDILTEIEDIISNENGLITDYEIRKKQSHIVLMLFVKLNKDNNIYKIIVTKQFSATGQFQKPILFPEIENSTGPKLCIIIDDAGYNNPSTYQFVKLPIKMGIAVLPFLKNSKKIAGLIKVNNKEVLLHMPMEPENYRSRQIKLFKKEILTSMSDFQINKTVDEMLNNIQYAAGINNHQGSMATSDRRVMTAVLKKVKRTKLFFIDSLTSKKSVTKGIAKVLEVNYGIRDVFLDNKDNYKYIEKQMKQLITIAQKRGKAIGIGHIGKKNTYKVIKDYISVIQSKGIEMVYPSEIIINFKDKEVSKNVTENINNIN